MIFNEYVNFKQEFGNRNFRVEVYAVSTEGLNNVTIKGYVQGQ